ncbi:MAG TPA: hypothetical protein VM534_09920, partial [Thermoanaerobaculia bacterium]|nr:hypothetical protein [Thermoanaerobaculia bacterium]
MAKKKKRSRPGEGPSVTIPDRRPLPPVVRWLTWLGAALTFWSFGFTMMRGSDLWWHIASGRWMIEHGEIPKTDSFSYTALGEQWVVDAWLSDLIYALWSRAFGMASLVWWKWGIIVAAFLLLFHVAVKLSKGRLGGPYAASLFGAAIAAPFLDIRPNLVSLLAFTILLALSV